VHRFQVKTEKLIVPLKRLETNPFEAICSYGAGPILREGRERGKVQVIPYDFLAIVSISIQRRNH